MSPPVAPRMLLNRMQPRDTTEPHRASTPLELFFDLTFVVAVSFAAVGLADDVETGHVGHGITVFLMVFFAIWWGWLNFTWFASAYDTDDWLYRLVTLVQMGGALTVAAGIPKAFSQEDFAVLVVGYVIMRAALVFQWLRAARNDPDRRVTAFCYVAGISTLQVLWVLRLLLPDSLGVISFVVLAVGELAVPTIAEHRAGTTFHRHHVAERYGLFTIIVLGEGVLAAGNSIIEALQDGEHITALVTLSISGLVLLAGMWWLYFAAESAERLDNFRTVFFWGYGHYAIFAAAAAVSSGIEIQVAVITGHAEVTAAVARLAIGLPTAVFVLLAWALLIRPELSGAAAALVPAGAVALLLGSLLPLPAASSAVLVAALLAVLVAGVVATGPRPGATVAAATDQGQVE